MNSNHPMVTPPQRHAACGGALGATETIAVARNGRRRRQRSATVANAARSWEDHTPPRLGLCCQRQTRSNSQITTAPAPMCRGAVNLEQKAGLLLAF